MKTYSIEEQLIKISRICLVVFLSFIGFGLLAPVDELGLHDPPILRVIHGVFIAGILALTFRSSRIRDNLQTLLNISFYTMSIHSFLVLYWNGLNISYLVGMVLVISCIGISFVQRNHLVIYLVFVILASIPVGLLTKNPTIPLDMYFPAIITPAIVSYLTLNVRLNAVSQLQDSEKVLAEYYYKISKDLEIARETQKSLITERFPQDPRFTMAGFYLAYDKVGGDILSIEKRPDGKYNILFADVSGHGISSSMVSAMAILAFQIVSRTNNMPAESLVQIHDLMKNFAINHHISACLATFDPENKILDYSYAGHPSIVLVRENSIQELEGRGSLLLSILPPKTTDFRKRLEPGDRILFFSDGMYELFNHNKEFYGEENFYKSVERNLQSTGTEFLEKLAEDSIQFANGNSEDDMTLLTIEITPEEKGV